MIHLNKQITTISKEDQEAMRERVTRYNKCCTNHIRNQLSRIHLYWIPKSPQKFLKRTVLIKWRNDSSWSRLLNRPLLFESSSDIVFPLLSLDRRICTIAGSIHDADDEDDNDENDETVVSTRVKEAAEPIR